MIIEAIPGMERVMREEPPQGWVILVTGEPGTLKSTFVYSLMLAAGKKGEGGKSIYITLEQPPETLLSNLKSVGVEPDDDMIEMVDFASLKWELNYNISFMADEAAEMVFSRIKDITKRGSDRPVMLALDSLNAFYILSSNDRRFRMRVEQMFQRLRKNGITSFLIMEKVDNTPRDEFFLADGIIELGVMKREEGKCRYLEVKKMRGVKHSLTPHLLEVTGEGLALRGEIID
ncbi:MAG: AAA family ATPase [Thermoplasmata archaeon]|nr:AAA family ATPase [Thermoplasmata archaeon]